MRKAGIREARQSLSVLLEEVGKGRSIAITDRGRPVALLVPAPTNSARGLPDLSALRQRNPQLTPALSVSVQDERDERL